jgi:hypothetical protein
MDTSHKDLHVSVLISSVTQYVWVFIRMKNVSDKSRKMKCTLTTK